MNLTCQSCKTSFQTKSLNEMDKTVQCPVCNRSVGTALSRLMGMVWPFEVIISLKKNELEVINATNWLQGFGFGLLAISIVSLICNFPYEFPYLFVGILILGVVSSALAFVPLVSRFFSTYHQITVKPTKIYVKNGSKIGDLIGTILFSQKGKGFSRVFDYEKNEIDQLYITERKQTDKNAKSYAYYLQLATTDGSHIELISGIQSPKQALRLEQAIEEVLGIEDKRVSNELKRGWRDFANANNLHFSFETNGHDMRVSGEYQSYQIVLVSCPPYDSYTMMLKGDKSANMVVDALHIEDLPSLVDKSKNHRWGEGEFRVNLGEHFMIFQSKDMKRYPRHLNDLMDYIIVLIEASYGIITLTGEAVNALRPFVEPQDLRDSTSQFLRGQVPEFISSEVNPNMRTLATQWLKAAAQRSQSMLPTPQDFLCQRCLTRCSTHEAKVSLTQTVAYNGCRLCHQSNDVYAVDTVVAVLDQAMTGDIIETDDTLRVNWLKQSNLFDFDRVEIINATDAQVERFAMQVGNDTDPYRELRYPNMSCVISPDCILAENTHRILQRTFQ